MGRRTARGSLGASTVALVDGGQYCPLQEAE
jgi:hypothetical protein